MSVKKLKEFSLMANIAVVLNEEQLNTIGQEVLKGFEEDEGSMSQGLSDIKRIEELASLKSVKKSYPLPNSANIKVPLITKACYEYASRVLPEIVRNDKVAQPRIIGIDESGFKKRAGQRACDYVNYALLLKSNSWYEDQFKLLFRQALIGFICKKTWFDPIKNKIKQIICKPDELIIHADSTSLEEAPRISHILHWRLNDIREMSNKTVNEQTLYLKEPVEALQKEYAVTPIDYKIDGIEQCTYLDLDEDGYYEPYVVTVLKDSGKVLRIVAQYEEEDVYKDVGDQVCYITKTDMYEDYHFLPNPEGKFQSVGFGILLLHLNESANSIMNQLVDAGQLANMKGGYADARLNIPSGNSLHDGGEFKSVRSLMGAPSLKDGIFPFQYGEPSSVLYQLLGMVMSISRDLTASAEVNNGTQSSQDAKTGATLALQAEGKKLASAINLSFYNSLSKELKHIFGLLRRFIDEKEYKFIIGSPMANKKDFDIEHVGIMPVADPKLSSDQQRLAEAGIIQQLMALPGVDPIEGTKLILDRVTIPGIEKLLPQQQPKQQMDPKMLEFQAEMEKNSHELRQKDEEIQLKAQDQKINALVAIAQIKQMEANTIVLLEKARSEPIKTQLGVYQSYLDTISKQLETDMGLGQMGHQQQLQGQQQQHEQQMQSNQQDHEASMQQQQPTEPAAPTEGGPNDQT